MVRRLLLVVCLLVLVGAGVGALVVTGRPPLRDADRTVDARWADLRPALDQRYAALAGLPPALTAAGAGDRAFTRALDDALAQWERLTASGADPGGEAGTANALEGLAARARADVAASPRLAAATPVTQAFAAFDAALVPAAALDAYNRAARDYQGVREQWSHRVAARAFDFGPRPVLTVD